MLATFGHRFIRMRAAAGGELASSAVRFAIMTHQQRKELEMRKFALVAMTATALPLLAAAPALAQQSGATPQHQAQQTPNQNPKPQSQAQRPQQSAANQNMNGQNGAQTLSQDEIRQAQQALDQKGFSVGRPDGKLGPRTKNALNQFQKKQGLQQTGQLDDQTVAALGIGGAASTTGAAPSDQQNGMNQKQSPGGHPQNQPAPGK